MFIVLVKCPFAKYILFPAKPCPKSDFDIPNGQISNGGSLIAVGALIKVLFELFLLHHLFISKINVQ